jgi:hypothetical protein
MRGRFEVVSVDAQGRPRRVWCQDANGNAWEEEWPEGVGPPAGPEDNRHLRGEELQRCKRYGMADVEETRRVPLAIGLARGPGRGAVSNYNPLDALKEQRE